MSRLSNAAALGRLHSTVDLLVPGNEDVDPSGMESSTVGFTERRGKMLRLSAAIDTECRTSMGCAGPVLTYIGRRRALIAASSASQGTTALDVQKFEMFSLHDSM